MGKAVEVAMIIRIFKSCKTKEQYEVARAWWYRIKRNYSYDEVSEMIWFTCGFETVKKQAQEQG